MNFVGPAFSTLKAPTWKIWLARIFGRKAVACDSGMRVTTYRWRGTTYITDCRSDQ